eukprot:1849885-Rhodomonas_salina.1
MVLRVCYGMRGTETGYGATQAAGAAFDMGQHPQDLYQVLPAILLHACLLSAFALATWCPVLT